MGVIDKLVIFLCQHTESETLPTRLVRAWLSAKDDKLYRNGLTEIEYDRLFKNLRDHHQLELTGWLHILRETERELRTKIRASPEPPSPQNNPEFAPSLRLKTSAIPVLLSRASPTGSVLPEAKRRYYVDLLDRYVDNLSNSVDVQSVLKTISVDDTTLPLELVVLQWMLERTEQQDLPVHFKCKATMAMINETLQDIRDILWAYKATEWCSRDWHEQILRTPLLVTWDAVHSCTLDFVHTIAHDLQADPVTVTNEKLERAGRVGLYVLSSVGPRHHEYRHLRAMSNKEEGMEEKEEKEESGNRYFRGQVVLSDYALHDIYGTQKLIVSHELQLVLDELASRAIRNGRLFLFPSSRFNEPSSKVEWQSRCQADFQSIWGTPLSPLHLKKAFVSYIREKGKLDTLLMRARTCKVLGTSLREINLLMALEEIPTSQKTRKRSRSRSLDSTVRASRPRTMTEDRFETTIDPTDPDMADEPDLLLLEPGEISG